VTVPIGPAKVRMLGTHLKSMSIPLILVSTYVYFVLDFGIAWLRVGIALAQVWEFFEFRESSADEVRFSLKVYISSVQNS
jgi:hypothetical protein